MKTPKFLKNKSFNYLEDAINEYISFHNNSWLENAKKTEIPIYDKDPKIRTKKLMELPVINSKKYNNLTYIFLGPFPQIPKYNIKLTGEIISVLQSTKSDYNDLLAYINNTYSVLLQTVPRFLSYEVTKYSNKSYFYSGLGDVIASNTNFIKEKIGPFYDDFEKEKRKQSEIQYEKMKNDISWFGELVKIKSRYGNNFLRTKEEKDKLKEINPDSRSLLVVCEDKDFANYFCKD